MAGTIKRTPCPKCSKVGGLFISIKLIAKPLGTFSLAGAQVKASAYQAPVLECSLCDFNLVGEFDGEEHAIFRPESNQSAKDNEVTTIDNIDESIHYDTVVFDPDLAKTFLEERGFERNRPIRNGKVGLLATKIATGRYKDNGTPTVSIAKDGMIRNGHHTLNAIVKSDCTIRLRVAWNIPDDTYDTFDTGALRSAADILASSGHTNTNALAALLRPVIRWERGVRTSGLFANDAAPNSAIMPSDYEDALSIFGDEIQAALLFSQAHKGTVSGNSTGRIRTRARALFNPTCLGLAYYILQPKPKGLEYLNSMVSGVNLTLRSPALAARTFFTEQNPVGVVAIATILRGYRRTIEGLDWVRVDASKFVGNPKLWEV